MRHTLQSADGSGVGTCRGTCTATFSEHLAFNATSSVSDFRLYSKQRGAIIHDKHCKQQMIDHNQYLAVGCHTWTDSTAFTRRNNWINKLRAFWHWTYDSTAVDGRVV